MRIMVVCVVIFLAAFQPVMAQASDWSEKLQQASSYVEEQFARNQVVGGALGIVHKDQLIHSDGFGVVDREQQAVPNKDTVYFAASITKVFTATVILQLHEAGKLDIDQPVQAYIPWFKLKDEASSAQLTIRHLLAHSAGGMGSMQTDGLVFAHKDAKDSLETYVRQFERIALTEEPGQTGNYCNGCYDILGYTIEAVTGQSYYEYMRKQLFEPLGMMDTVYGKDLATLSEERIAKEYSWFFTGKLHLKRSYEEFGAAQDPDGGAYSTIEDLGKFISYQLGYASHSAIGQLHDVKEYRVGYVANETGDAEYTTSGFKLKEIEQTKAYYKTGDGIGSSSVILFVPEHEIGVALLLGEMHPEIQLGIAEGVARIMMGLTPEDVAAQMTFGKLLGIVAMVLIGASLLLLLWFIRSLRVGTIYKKSYWSISLSLLCWGALCMLLWWLLLAVRPSAMGWFGYPYDLSIGLMVMTAICSLWLCHSVAALFVLKSKRKTNHRTIM